MGVYSRLTVLTGLANLASNQKNVKLKKWEFFTYMNLYLFLLGFGIFLQLLFLVVDAGRFPL